MDISTLEIYHPHKQIIRYLIAGNFRMHGAKFRMFRMKADLAKMKISACLTLPICACVGMIHIKFNYQFAERTFLLKPSPPSSAISTNENTRNSYHEYFFIIA